MRKLNRDVEIENRKVKFEFCYENGFIKIIKIDKILIISPLFEMIYTEKSINQFLTTAYYRESRRMENKLFPNRNNEKYNCEICNKEIEWSWRNARMSGRT